MIKNILIVAKEFLGNVRGDVISDLEKIESILKSDWKNHVVSSVLEVEDFMEKEIKAVETDFSGIKKEEEKIETQAVLNVNNVETKVEEAKEEVVTTEKAVETDVKTDVANVEKEVKSV